VNPVELRGKMKTVKNIYHVVKSMETLATMKIMKLRGDAEKRKLYAASLHDILTEMYPLLSDIQPENALLYTGAEEKKPLLLIITSDRGFSGNMNVLVLSQARHFMQTHQNTSCIVIGRKASVQLEKENFSQSAIIDMRLDTMIFSRTQHITSDLVKSYLKGYYDSVYISYMSFENILKQKPVTIKLLPIDKKTSLKKSVYHYPIESFVILPDLKRVFKALVRKYLDAMIYRVLLEAAASEQAIRMVSMKSASDNAEEVFNQIKQKYQKMRQEKITRELIELSSFSQASRKQE